MKKSDLFLMAIQNLKNRKTRTRLTVIGVIIGTCAIVIMVSIGIGIDKMITSQYDSDTTLNKITVYGSVEDDENSKEMPFDDSAVKYFEGLQNVKMVVPTINVEDYVSISRGRYTTSWTTIKAIDFSVLEELGYTLSEGSFSNISTNSPILFGSKAVTEFVDHQGNTVKYKYDKDYNVTDCEIDPMKDTFMIGAKITNSNSDDDSSSNVDSSSMKKVKVAGVLKENNKIDYDISYSIYIDMDTAKELIKESQKLSGNSTKFPEYSQINVYVDGMKNVSAVQDLIKDSGFGCYSDQDEIEYTKKVMKVVQLVLGAIGAISMFVAAFGISNTMVMSVYERTKEIGIMKVLGCDIKDIKALFLYEAGTIGFLGGTIGMIISYILSIIANIIAKIVASNINIGDDIKVCVSSIPPWLAISGILFSILIGVIAGISPAKRSVKVSALTAIHNE